MSTNPTFASGRNTMTNVAITPQITGGLNFLPHYEETLNRNLRTFGSLEGHAKLQPFDKIQKPVGRPTLSRRAKMLIIAGSIICYVILMAAIITGALYTSSHQHQQSVSVPPLTTQASTSTATVFVIAETSSQASVSIRSDSFPTVTATITVIQTASPIQPQTTIETATGIIFAGSGGPGSVSISTEAYTSFITIIQPAGSSAPSSSRSEIIISPIATSQLTAQTVWTEVGTWITGSSTWTETNLVTVIQASFNAASTSSISSASPLSPTSSPSKTIAAEPQTSTTPPPASPSSLMPTSTSTSHEILVRGDVLVGYAGVPQPVYRVSC